MEKLRRHDYSKSVANPSKEVLVVRKPLAKTSRQRGVGPNWTNPFRQEASSERRLLGGGRLASD